MNKVPLTVALMTYNRGSTYLKEAIEGILNQTYEDFEFLILDNHSTDDTPSIVMGYDDHRIRYVRNAPGLTATFNGVSAMQIARGERLIITHDDDVMLPTLLEKQMALMDANPDITAVWTNVQVIDETGAQIQPYLIPKGEDRFYGLGEYIFRFPSEQLLPLPSALMLNLLKTPRILFADWYYFGGKRHAQKNSERHGGDDVLIPATLNTCGPVVFMNEPLLKYRRHGAQDTNEVHISIPILNTYKALHKLLNKVSAKVPDSNHSIPLLANYVARYTAQHELAHAESENLGFRRQAKLARLLERGLANVELNSEAIYPLLPLLVFAARQEQNAVVEKLCALLTTPDSSHAKAVHALSRWVVMRRRKLNLFAHIPQGASIAILGSAFIAALLIDEARGHAREVVCLDSKTSRQNRTMLGISIYGPDWLRHNDVDYVVLSSERDQENYLHKMIADLNPKAKVVSWKDLVTE
jgi:glycosyltransferase involved in cell wall biosynthesis